MDSLTIATICGAFVIFVAGFFADSLDEIISAALTRPQPHQSPDDLHDLDDIGAVRGFHDHSNSSEAQRDHA